MEGLRNERAFPVVREAHFSRVGTTAGGWRPFLSFRFRVPCRPSGADSGSVTVTRLLTMYACALLRALTLRPRRYPLSQATESFYISYLENQLEEKGVTVSGWERHQGQATQLVRAVDMSHPIRVSFPGTPSHARCHRIQVTSDHLLPPHSQSANSEGGREGVH